MGLHSVDRREGSGSCTALRYTAFRSRPGERTFTGPLIFCGALLLVPAVHKLSACEMEDEKLWNSRESVSPKLQAACVLSPVVLPPRICTRRAVGGGAGVGGRRP